MTGNDIESLDAGRMAVARDFLPLLRANGLDSFEKVMAVADGEVFRNFPGRRTVRLELKTAAGLVQAIYLKRYERDYLSPGRRLLRWLRWPGTEDEAWREWQMIQAVSSIGIKTATRIAVGQHRRGGIVTRSFLMTAEITGGEEGHRYAKRLSAPERHRLLLRTAELARRFHAAGYVHKDFYLGHLLVAPSDGEPGLFLIDLQRVMMPQFFCRRWIVKDLAALGRTALRAGESRADLLRCFLEYRAHPALCDQDRQLARKVLRRMAWLASRMPKHDVDLESLA